MLTCQSWTFGVPAHSPCFECRLGAGVALTWRYLFGQHFSPKLLHHILQFVKQALKVAPTER